MFRFFRYFLALFFVINVLPLIGILLWDQYHFQAFDKELQRSFFSSTQKHLNQLIARHAEDEFQHDLHILSALPSQGLDITNYRSLFDTPMVWYINPKGVPLQNPQGKNKHLPPLSVPQPVNRLLTQLKPSQLVKQYVLIPANKKEHYDLATVNVLPLPKGQPYPSLLIVKPVAIHTLLPQGPFVFEMYQGDVISKSTYMTTAIDPFLKTMFKQTKAQQDKAPRDVLSLGNAPPPPLDPDLVEKGPLNLPVQSHQIVSIKNRLGETVAQLVIHNMMKPPGGPLRDKSLIFGMIIIGAGVVFSLLAGLYIKKQFFSPLIQLATATQSVHGGDLSVQIQTEHISQPDVLATCEIFNAMVGKLAEKEELQRNFIANLTHDLKTPLLAQERTLVLLANEFDLLDQPEQAQLARGLAQNNQHLIAMVNQLLEVYKFEAGKLKLQLDPIDIAQLAYNCADHLKSLADENQVTIETHFPSNTPRVLGDAQALTRVVNNLLGNAIENSPKNAHILLSLHMNPSDRPVPEILLSVHNTGTSISDHDRAHLFDRYFSGTNDTRRLGSGLGLYICKMFVEAHGGSIRVESVPNDGTRFVVQLPTNSSPSEQPREGYPTQ